MIAAVCLLRMPAVAQDSVNDFLRDKGFLAMGMSVMDGISEERKGWWRLSQPIAVRYGLEVGESYDQRMDPVWSTEAAECWWRDLYAVFQDTVLADHAFVYGPSAAVKLSHNGQEYVRARRKYNDWQEESLAEYPEFGATDVEIAGGFYVEDVVEMLRLDSLQVAEFRAGNPALTGYRVDTTVRAQVRLPSRVSADFITELHTRYTARKRMEKQRLLAARERIAKGLPEAQEYMKVIHSVRPGEFLGSIARKYQVEITEIKKWNELNSDLIRIDQKLVIYVSSTMEVAEMNRP